MLYICLTLCNWKEKNVSKVIKTICQTSCSKNRNFIHQPSGLNTLQATPCDCYPEDCHSQTNNTSRIIRRGPGAVVKAACLESRRSRVRTRCSASDHQGSNFESCVWRAVSSHHPQFSLYVHKGGLKPHFFHFILLRLLQWTSVS